MLQDWECQFGNVKAIIQKKKSINLGEVPHNFHVVSSKLSELEGTFTDGFDNNIRYLLNKKNWHGENLINGKPQVSIRRHMNEYAYDFHCFPMIEGEAQAVVKPYHPLSPFKEYNPASLGPLTKIPGLSSFISMTIRCGDDADLELLKYAHMLIEQLVDLLTQSLNVEEIIGQSIKETFIYIDQQLKEMKT